VEEGYRMGGYGGCGCEGYGCEGCGGRTVFGAYMALLGCFSVGLGGGLHEMAWHGGFGPGWPRRNYHLYHLPWMGQAYLGSQVMAFTSPWL
jgi:hypothetical protein